MASLKSFALIVSSFRCLFTTTHFHISLGKPNKSQLISLHRYKTTFEALLYWRSARLISKLIYFLLPPHGLPLIQSSWAKTLWWPPKNQYSSFGRRTFGDWQCCQNLRYITVMSLTKMCFSAYFISIPYIDRVCYFPFLCVLFSHFRFGNTDYCVASSWMLGGRESLCGKRLLGNSSGFRSRRGRAERRKYCSGKSKCVCLVPHEATVRRTLKYAYCTICIAKKNPSK